MRRAPLLLVLAAGLAAPPSLCQAQARPPRPVVGPAAPSGTVAGSIAAPLPAHAVVWLEGPALPRPPRPTAPVELASEGTRLLPSFTVALVGQSVAFPQTGALVHRYFSGSPARPFDLGSYGRGVTRSVRLDRPGVVEVLCRYHDETHATIAVLPSALYARPDPTGHFRLGGVPPGRYALRAHSPEGGPVWLRIEVQPGATLTVPPLAFPRHYLPDEQLAPRDRGESAHPPQFELR